MKHCKDCEPAQQSHFFAYWSVVFELVSEPISNIMELLFRNTTEAISRRISVPFFRLMTFLRLGHFSLEPDQHDSWRTKCFWEEANKREIKMREFHLGAIRNIFMAEYKEKTITFDGLPRVSAEESKSLEWMDNKGIMKEKFKKVGLPVAEGGVAWNRRQALEIFNRLRKPVITKPNVGSRSRHTMIHIHTPKDLIIGFRKAKVLSPFVVIEEELNGYLFRGTLINGKLVGVVKRDQPEVVGDGIQTLRALWQKENQRPERAGPIFHKITVDAETEKELHRQGVTMDDVPAKGKVITFSQKTSRGCGGTTTEVSDIVHPENVKMLEDLGAFLNDPLVGVDFIMEDITKSWREPARHADASHAGGEQHSGIIECNSLPFIDLHHYPMFGRPNNIAGKLWDFVMPESKKSKIN